MKKYIALLVLLSGVQLYASDKPHIKNKELVAFLNELIMSEQVRSNVTQAGTAGIVYEREVTRNDEPCALLVKLTCNPVSLNAVLVKQDVVRLSLKEQWLKNAGVDSSRSFKRDDTKALAADAKSNAAASAAAAAAMSASAGSSSSAAGSQSSAVVASSSGLEELSDFGAVITGQKDDPANELLHLLALHVSRPNAREPRIVIAASTINPAPKITNPAPKSSSWCSWFCCRSKAKTS
jgi:hypothetical protein